jgi:hypothetical protein
MNKKAPWETKGPFLCAKRRCAGIGQSASFLLYVMGLAVYQSANRSGVGDDLANA